METIFKVEMEVYDQFVFPNKEGKVLKIEELSNYPVRVTFGKPGITWGYTRDGRYYSNMEPSLSTSPYSIEGFEQKAPAPNYEEILLERGAYVSITKPLSLPDENLANAFEALAKLIWLRDYYNEGWKPDWKDDTIRKYNIFTELGKVEKGNSFSANRILSFRTEEIRNKFLEEQIDLLEIAKPLL